MPRPDKTYQFKGMPPITVKQGGMAAPKKPSIASRLKKGAVEAIGKLPTGFGVTTKKKGVLRVKDTMKRGG